MKAAKSRTERFYGGTCSGCDAKWTAMKAAHCAASECHRTFSTPVLFDRHRVNGRCVDPETIISAPRDGSPGERVMFFRDGMWRGPEWTPAFGGDAA